MKRLTIIALAMMVALTACAARRHKLSAQGNVNLKTANVYYNQQNVDEAKKYYTLVLQDNPDHAHALRRIGDINLFEGEKLAEIAVARNIDAYKAYDKAILVMSQYTKPTEDELAALRDMKKRRTSAWTRVFKKAEDQQIAGNTQEALNIYQQVADLDPARTEPLIKMKEIYLKELKDEAKALQILEQIYAKDPNDPLLLQEMGIFHMNKKDYASATPFLEKVKQLEPTNTNNLLNLSYCYFEQGNYDAAKVNNLLVLANEPANLDALNDAKLIALKLGDQPGAVSYLRRLLEIRNDTQDFIDIVYLLNELKNYEDLIVYAKKWYSFDELNKDAVQLVILGANKTGNKALETEYQNILKNMK